MSAVEKLKPDFIVTEGAVVRLRSGGPAMTVSKLEYSALRGGDVARCHWIDDNGQGREYSFPTATLMQF